MLKVMWADGSGKVTTKSLVCRKNWVALETLPHLWSVRRQSRCPSPNHGLLRAGCRLGSWPSTSPCLHGHTSTWYTPNCISCIHCSVWSAWKESSSADITGPCHDGFVSTMQPCCWSVSNLVSMGNFGPLSHGTDVVILSHLLMLPRRPSLSLKASLQLVFTWKKKLGGKLSWSKRCVHVFVWQW
jgi:hypothetical protein